MSETLTELRSMLAAAERLARSEDPILARAMPRVVAIVDEVLLLSDPGYVSVPSPSDTRGHT